MSKCKTIKVYMGTHGPECKIIPDYCVPIELGGALRSNFHYDIRDNAKEDNISEKNKEWCELTGLYYMWKHETADVQGLYHYRRTFALTKSQILKRLEHHDVIAADIWTPIKIEDSLKRSCPSGSYERALEAIRKIHPDYLDDAKKLMQGHLYYGCQMFIASKEWVDSYCEWLFPMLFEIEETIKESEIDPRYMGYIAEAMCLSTYIVHNHFRVAKQSICFFGEGLHFQDRFFSSRLWANPVTHMLKNIYKKLRYRI